MPTVPTAKKFMSKLHTYKYAILGELIKLKSHLYTEDLSDGLNKKTSRERQVVISLTSYGRRAKEIVDTTIKSLLKQSYKPDRIILWLDEDNWNLKNLPSRLKKLMEYGVEIRFCKDLKSYKKLIPTLPLVSDNDYIITVDDDQYYPTDFVKVLVDAMDNDSTSIYGIAVRKLLFDKNNKLRPYNEWKLCTEKIEGETYLATGCCGIIYTKSMFHTDIDNESLYMELAPKADDLWFFFMALLNGVRCVPVKLHQVIIDIDFFYQKFHSNSSLRDSNLGESLNDVQFRNIMNHYHITDGDL